jgi:hypothetical protein
MIDKWHWFNVIFLIGDKNGSIYAAKKKDYGYRELTTSILLCCQWNYYQSNDCGGVLHSWTIRRIYFQSCK